MQQHAVPLGKVLLPVLLPFGQYMLFKEMVRFDNDQRSGGLKAHTPFYADNRIPHMRIPPDSKRRSQVMNPPDGLYRVSEFPVIHRFQFPFYKIQGDLHRLFL
ncbi:hypothetical protein D9M69_697270 [compost metagenome]